MEGGAILNRKDAGLLQASVDKGDQIDRLADRIIKCEQQIFILPEQIKSQENVSRLMLNRIRANDEQLRKDHLEPSCRPESEIPDLPGSLNYFSPGPDAF